MNKRAVPFLIITLMLGLSGCTNTHPTAAVSVGTSIQILAQISRQEFTSSTFGQTVYMVAMVDEGSGTAVTGAVVTVTGPAGSTILTEDAPGVYAVQYVGSDFTSYYQFNQVYTVTVVFAGKTFTAAGTAPGSVTIPANGSNVSWLYEGNGDIITVIGPDTAAMATTTTAAADSDSPVDINAMNIYSNGPGMYTIQANIIQAYSNPFSETNSDSSLIFINQVMAQVSK